MPTSHLLAALLSDPSTRQDAKEYYHELVRARGVAATALQAAAAQQSEVPEVAAASGNPDA